MAPSAHTLLISVSILTLVLTACRPKQEEEVVGTPPPEDRVAPLESAERYPLQEIDPVKNQAWFKKCYRATSLESFQVTPDAPTRDILFSATFRPSTQQLSLDAVAKTDVDLPAMQRCLLDALSEDGAHLPLDRTWTTGHVLTITAREDGAENIDVAHYKPITGPVSNDERQTQLVRLFPDIQRCYGRALKVTPGAEGTFLARYGVDKNGYPENLVITSTINDPNLKTCLQSIFSKMRFSPAQAPTRVKELIVLAPN